VLSFWERESLLDYDCLIIGSGIVGLSTAAELVERNARLRIAVLERGLLPAGASTRNAGFATFGSPTELLEHIEQEGKDKMLALTEERLRGLEKLKKRLSSDSIGFEQNGGYELLRENELYAIDALPALNQMLKPIFRAEAFVNKSNQISELGFSKEYVKALVYSPFEGQINTGNMLKALTGYVISKGVNIITGAQVFALNEDTNGLTVQVQEAVPGRMLNFRARHLAVCTNAFAKQLFPDLEVVPGRGQVVVTKPIKELPFKGVFHFDKGYYYFRNIGDRVLFGGGRNLDFNGETTTSFGRNEKIIQSLEEYLKEMILPDRDYEIDMQWSGIMAFGPERNPIVKKLSPRISAGLRMHGMGIALGSTVAEKLAALMEV
jgi:gamma-glutamylputrescine oxidase